MKQLPGTIKFKTRMVSLATVLALFCVATFAFEAKSATIESFLDVAMHELGFDPAQKDSLEAGKVISIGLPGIERQTNEVAVGAAMMLVRRPLAVVAEALVDDTSFRVNTDVLDYGSLGDGMQSEDEIAALFAKVGYTEAESAETAHLLKFKGGSRFNLSASEIEKFRAIKADQSDTGELISTTMADVLQQRFSAYVANGLESVEPYDRAGSKNASPKQELKVAFEKLTVVKQFFPDFYTTLLNYPKGIPAGTGSRFYWIKRKAGDRPAFVLAHRIERRESDYAVAAELHFYAGHSYNSMLSLIACVSTDEGTLVLSAIRLFTDQVRGFGSSMKKSIGRKRLVEAMIDYFEDMQKELEKTAG